MSRATRKQRKERPAPSPSGGAPSAPGAVASGGGGGRWPLWLAFAAAAAVAGALAFYTIDSPDIGFHLSLGRWMTANHAWPFTDPLTETLRGRPFIDLQWLFQLAVWAVYSAAGTLGLVTGNLLLTVTAVAVAVLRTVRERSGPPTLAVPLLLLLFFLGNTWEIRPHAASWVLLGLELLVLEEHRRWPGRLVWLLPVLQCVWANVHSLHILGLAAMAAYAVPQLLRGRAADRRLLGATLAAVAACLVNPWTYQALLFPLGQFLMIAPGSAFKTGAGLQEFASPLAFTTYTANRALVLYQPFLFLQLYGLVALVGFLAAVRRCGWAERLVFVGFAAIFASGQKNFGYFAFATFPLIAGGLAWCAPSRPRPARRAAWFGATVAAALALAVVLQVASGWFYAHQRLPTRAGHRFNEELLPVRAAAFLARPEVPAGRMLNTFGDGGYLGFATRRPVFIDGRAELLGAELFGEITTIETDAQMASLVARFQIDLAVVPFNEEATWFRFFETSAAWRCVYADDRDLIYLRNGFAPQVPRLAPSAPAARFPDGWLERALERRDPGFLRGCVGPHYYPLAELRRTGCLLLRGDDAAALAVGAAGLERSTFVAPDLLVNVGHALWETGQQRDAARCYDAALRHGLIYGAAPQLKRVLLERIFSAAP